MNGQIDCWRASLTDPFRGKLLPAGDDFASKVEQCAEPLRGEPAFDPQMIDRIAKQITLPSQISFRPFPILERVVRVGLAHISATFQGDHPKYGVGEYAQERHDTFPPTIISAVDALTLWGSPPERKNCLHTGSPTSFARTERSITTGPR